MRLLVAKAELKLKNNYRERRPAVVVASAITIVTLPLMVLYQLTDEPQTEVVAVAARAGADQFEPANHGQTEIDDEQLALLGPDQISTTSTTPTSAAAPADPQTSSVDGATSSTAIPPTTSEAEAEEGASPERERVATTEAAPSPTEAPPADSPPPTSEAPPETSPPTTEPPPPATSPPTTTASPPTTTRGGEIASPIDPWPYYSHWPSVDQWHVLAGCEAFGQWDTDTGNGYYGGLQFSLDSWQGVGGEGYPNQAPAAEQIYRGNLLWERQGWNAWPGCARSLGWL
jgi:hypothetical protein